MILYLLQQCPYLMVLAKANFSGAFSQHFNTLAAFIQIMIQGRQLSIRDTFAYYRGIALSHNQNNRKNTSKIEVGI
jgi:hypothetical protein